MKEPTLAECVEVLTELHLESVQDGDASRTAAIGHVIDICVRLQQAPDFNSVMACCEFLPAFEKPQPFAHDVWSAALAWARGER